MSWYNPSQDEAADEYYSSKSRYNNAANQRCAAMRAAENCCAERASALSAIDSCISDKINFEKRMEDIRAIIGAIEGSSGGCVIGSSIPEVISIFNEFAKKNDESYKGGIKSPDILAASIFEVFKGKSVDEDPHLSDALQKFKDELARLEKAISELQAQMNSLSDLISDLSSKINMFNVESANWRKVMISSAFEMNHFKGYM